MGICARRLKASFIPRPRQFSRGFGLDCNFPRPTRIRCLSVPQKTRIGKMARQVIETRATTENIPAARMRPPEASMERRSTERPRADAGAEMDTDEIGRAHVRTPVTNANLVCRLLLEKNKLPKCTN